MSYFNMILLVLMYFFQISQERSCQQWISSVSCSDSQIETKLASNKASYKSDPKKFYCNQHVIDIICKFSKKILLRRFQLQCLDGQLTGPELKVYAGRTCYQVETFTCAGADKVWFRCSDRNLAFCRAEREEHESPFSDVKGCPDYREPPTVEHAKKEIKGLLTTYWCNEGYELLTVSNTLRWNKDSNSWGGSKPQCTSIPKPSTIEITTIKTTTKKEKSSFFKGNKMLLASILVLMIILFTIIVALICSKFCCKKKTKTTNEENSEYIVDNAESDRYSSRESENKYYSLLDNRGLYIDVDLEKPTNTYFTLENNESQTYDTIENTIFE